MMLVVTGCIQPVPQPYLKLMDPSIRWRQYQESLIFYLQCKSLRRVVFVENSGYPFDVSCLEAEAQKQGKEFECLQFSDQGNQVANLGKGYGEGKLIQYALENSRFRNETTCFIKVTGRLVVRNLDDILPKLCQKTPYFNRDFVRNNLNALDTRIYASPIAFFENTLLNAYNEVTVENTLERIYFEKLSKGHHSYSCFPRYPLFEGISGGDQRDYGSESSTLRALLQGLSICRLYNCPTFMTQVLRLRK